MGRLTVRPRLDASTFSYVSVLALSVFGYPLVAPIPVLLGVPNQLISVPFRALVLVLALLIIGGSVVHRRIRRGPVWVLWWAYWGLYLCRLSIDTVLNEEVLRLDAYEYFAFAVGLSLLPAVALSMRGDSNSLGTSIRWMIRLGIMAILLSLTAIIAGGESLALELLLGARQGIYTLNPISMSNVGASLSVLSLWVILSRTSRSEMSRSLLVVGLAIGLVTAFLGASKGPLLALAVALPIVIAAAYRHYRPRRPAILGAVGVLGLVTLVSVLTLSDRLALMMRLSAAAGGADESTNTRLDLWRRSYETIGENPLLGGGIEPLGFYPHNLFLESFVFFGVTSGLLFVALVCGSLWSAWRIFHFDRKHAWVAALYVQYLINAMFSFAIYDSWIFWCLMALVIARSGALVTRRAILIPYQGRFLCHPKGT